MNLTVLHDPLALHPLGWIHRIEARGIAAEFERAGHAVRLVEFHEDRIPGASPEALLLRLSDPVMLTAVRALTHAGRRYFGPAAAVMTRCYDKYEASRLALSRGVACPATTLASAAGTLPFPVVVKPRSGSDSLGVRVLRHGPIPAYLQTSGHIAQEQVRGVELTVGVTPERAGHPLRLVLPEGTPHSFARKYLFRPRREVLADPVLSERVRATALAVARMFEINWAARVDFIYDTRNDRLCLLECDAAPLVGPSSAFAASLCAAGITREEQLRSLIDDTAG